MKINFAIFLITAFLIANTYYDGKFTEYLMKGKKYYKMATFAFVGLSIYLFINKYQLFIQTITFFFNIFNFFI